MSEHGSDEPREGWWQASDGRWYPPEAVPGDAPSSASLPSASLPSASLPSASLPSASLPSASLPSSALPADPTPGPRFLPPEPVASDSGTSGAGAPTPPSSPADRARANATGDPNAGLSIKPLVMVIAAVALLSGLVVGAFAYFGSSDAEPIAFTGDPPANAPLLEPATPDGQPSPVATAEPPGTDPPSIGFDDTSLAYNAAVPVVFETYGNAAGSLWNVTVGEPYDMTATVLGRSPANEPPPEGALYAGIDVELTLAAAGFQPLAAGLSFEWEILGGASGSTHNASSYPGVYGCGILDDEFDQFGEAFNGGTISGTVCIPLPQEDLDHPDTRIAMTFGGSRTTFSAAGASPEPATVEPARPATNATERAYEVLGPLTLDTYGDADGSVWNVYAGVPTDITAEILEANPYNEVPPAGIVFAGFDVELALASADSPPLALGNHATWEIHGGATARVYDGTNVEELLGCGVFDDQVAGLVELFPGGSLSGRVCIPVPAEDLAHPDTRLALRTGDTRLVFSADGPTAAPASIEPGEGIAGSGRLYPLSEPAEVLWQVYGVADNSVWTMTVEPWRDITEQVVAESGLNSEPSPGIVFAGFDIAMTLAESDAASLSPGYSADWEIYGGATLQVHSVYGPVFGDRCGFFDGEYDPQATVATGETITGTVCIALPREDLDHPDTRVSFTMNETRILFGPDN